MSASELIEALCGRGWDAPISPELERAAALLNAGPELDVFTAAAVGDPATLARLLDAEPEAASRPGGPRGWPPLLYAASSFAHQLPGGDPLGALELLLARGADPDSAYFVPEWDNGFSALYLSIAVTGDRARVDALLAAGAHPSDGNSSYHAVETFDLGLLEALGRAGLEHDDISYTLKHALDLRWAEAVRRFLDWGADPNALHPRFGETSLHWAALRGASAEVFGWLLEAGGDPMARTRPGETTELGLTEATPLDYALLLGEVELVGLMENSGATPSPATPAQRLLRAVARGDAEAARRQLAALGGVEALQGPARDMLAHWAQYGAAAAVALALDLGFPMEATAWLGLPALHWAALRGDAEMVGALLEAGAPQVDLGGHFGTPAHTARTCQWFDSGDYGAVLVRLASD
ncbi:MAG: hypothetical protein H6740_25675 [Alphaproteobacteria bacterium]|nr:hypothetical protein [Alphaproteobacteria bacterium]